MVIMQSHLLAPNEHRLCTCHKTALTVIFVLLPHYKIHSTRCTRTMFFSSIVSAIMVVIMVSLFNSQLSTCSSLQNKLTSSKIPCRNKQIRNAELRSFQTYLPRDIHFGIKVIRNWF